MNMDTNTIALVEQHLQQSIVQYTEILDQTDLLEKMLNDSDYQGITQYAKELQKRQAKAEQDDEILLELLSENPMIWRDNQFYTKRLKIIQAIVEKNKVLIPRLKAVMAVAGSERAELSRGRTAVEGYTVTTKKNRSISRTA